MTIQFFSTYLPVAVTLLYLDNTGTKRIYITATSAGSAIHQGLLL